MTENQNTQPSDEENPATTGDEPFAENADGDGAAEQTGGPDTQPDPQTDQLEERLAAAETALAEEKERFVRLYAEFENYKKRSAREIQDYRKYANETLIRELLPIIDNLERAIQSSGAAAGDANCIVQGVDMTLKEILRALEKFNVQPIQSVGEPFDPNYHEAVGKEPSAECEEGKVLREYQRGYLLHDRLVRPAMVVVSAGGPAPEAEAAVENEAEPEENGGRAESE
jgi:molecular chaperone GrpE